MVLLMECRDDLEKESLGLKASKIFSFVNALWQKKTCNKYCLTGEAVQWASCFCIIKLINKVTSYFGVNIS